MNTQFVQGDAFFTCINENIKQYPYLTKDIETEVIIVGGGVTGAILGYYFSKNKIKAVILEKGRIAHGSTSITTSLLQYELDGNASELEAVTSKDNIAKSYYLGLDALNEINEFINTYGNKCNYKPLDSLLYTEKDLEIKEMELEYSFRKNANLDVEYVKDSSKYGLNLKAGVIGKNGAAVFDPYKYTHHLLDVARENSLEVYENSEVVNIKYNEDNVEATTIYNYKVKGKIVIVATGFNTKLFTDKDFGTKTTTFNVVTKPIKDLDDIYHNIVVRDNIDPYHYLRATEDNRLIYGGEDINFEPDIYNEELCNKSYDKLEQKLKTLFPKLNLEIEYKYCGAFASTKDNLGFVGKDKDHKNLWYCLGYGANGILFATLGAKFLSKLYKGEEDPNMSLFYPYRF